MYLSAHLVTNIFFPAFATMSNAALPSFSLLKENIECSYARYYPENWGCNSGKPGKDLCLCSLDSRGQTANK